MSTRRHLIAGALVGTLAISGLAIAGHGGPHRGGPHHGGPFGHVGRVIAALDLSPEQQAKLDALRQEARLERGDRAGHTQSFQVILGELEREQPDAARLHGLIDAHLDATRQRAHDHLDRMLELHATLTPEQRATLVAELEAGKERMKEHRSRRGGAGPRGR